MIYEVEIVNFTFVTTVYSDTKTLSVSQGIRYKYQSKYPFLENISISNYLHYFGIL